MRFILKVFALPVMLAVGLLKAVLSFFCSTADWICGVLSSIILIVSLYTLFIEGNTAEGLRYLVITFLISPYGIPAVAWWIIEKLDDLSYSLHCFITD